MNIKNMNLNLLKVFVAIHENRTLTQAADQIGLSQPGVSHALTRMGQLTGNYTPPDDACNSYRGMLDGLRGLEADLHQHIHKENNILFPRAIEAESCRCG